MCNRLLKNTEGLLKFWKSLPFRTQEGVLFKKDALGQSLIHRVALNGNSTLFLDFWKTTPTFFHHECLFMTTNEGWTVAHCAARYIHPKAFLSFWYTIDRSFHQRLALLTPNPTLSVLVYDHCGSIYSFFWATLSKKIQSQLLEK